MSKKSKASQADINTFRKAVKGVKPLVHNKTRLAPSTNIKKPLKPPKYKEEVFDLKESSDLPLVRGDEYIAYKHESISNKILRKLNKGQYNVDAVLDLHGMTTDKAKKAVDSFLQECLHEKIRVALIIHGKGLHKQMPILKNKLNQWLRNIDIVLAFCSAASGHGSRGAIYVLLKRAREENSFE